MPQQYDKQFQLAIQECEKSLKKDPQHPHVLYRKSVVLTCLKENSESISCINEALKYNNNYSVGYSMKGWLLLEQKKYNDALICFDKAIQTVQISQISIIKRVFIL